MSEPKPAATTTITDLNPDSLAHCANFLNLQDVTNLALTCKPLSIAASHDAIWRRLFRERWPNQCVGSGDGWRGKYLDSHTAVNQFKFNDPVEVVSFQYDVPHSHVLIKKHEAFLAQGSMAHKWRLDSPEVAHETHETLLGHRARITCMRLFPISDTSLFRNEMQNEDNVLATSSSDRTIRLWWKGRSQRCFRGHTGPVTTLADKLLGNCGSKVLASGGEDCTVRLWSVGLSRKHQSQTMTYHGHEKPISLLSVARHKTSLLVSISTDSKVRVWDASSASSSTSSSCVGMTSINGVPVGMKCHDTMCYIAAGSSVTAIDLRIMQKVSTTAVHIPYIYSFEMLPSKWLICTGGQDKAMLWDIRKSQVNPEPITELEPEGGYVSMLHMDPYKVVTGGPFDCRISVWETDTGNLANQLDCRLHNTSEVSTGVSAMAVDGCRIITTCNAAPGLSCLRDFSNCSDPISSPDCNSSSKFWESHSLMTNDMIND